VQEVAALEVLAELRGVFRDPGGRRDLRSGRRRGRDQDRQEVNAGGKAEARGSEVGYRKNEDSFQAAFTLAFGSGYG
jgi:hypothetical protein